MMGVVLGPSSDSDSLTNVPNVRKQVSHVQTRAAVKSRQPADSGEESSGSLS
jgi:hypothetical protein